MLSPTKMSTVAMTKEQAKKNYGDDPYFTIKWHHGGEFVLEPTCYYVNGKVHYSDFCFMDTFCMTEVNKIVKGLGYCGIMFYHYLVPGSEIPLGLKPLGGDIDLHNFLQCCKTTKLMELFIEHHTTVIYRHFMSPWSKSNVVIEELPTEVDGVDGSISLSTRGCKQKLLPWLCSFDDADSAIVSQSKCTQGKEKTKSAGTQSKPTESKDKNKSPVVEVMSSSSGSEYLGGNLYDNDGNDWDEDSDGSEESDEGDGGEDSDEGDGSEEENDNNSLEEENDKEFEEENDENTVEEEDRVDHGEDSAQGTIPNQRTRRSDRPEEGTNFTFVSCGYEDSDYANDEDILSVHSSDDERLAFRVRGRVPEFNPSTDLANPVFFLKQRFANKQQVLDAVKRYSVCSRRPLKIVKNDKLRVRVLCQSNFEKNDAKAKADMAHSKQADEGQSSADHNAKGAALEEEEPRGICPFVLHISKLCYETDWQVKTFTEEHNCNESRHNKYFTSEEIAKQYAVDYVRENPNVPIKSIMSSVKKASELEMSKYQAYRARVIAKRLVYGDWMGQYSMLWDYCNEVKRVNPNTTIEIQLGDAPLPESSERHFFRMYTCLGALKAGWKAGCRKFIGVDGCFLKGPYPSQLLSAVGIDANDGIYPIAWAVVDKENKENWKWFLGNLMEDLDLEQNSHCVLMSDMQKGLIPAVEEIWPSVEHRFCMYHVYSGFKKTHKGVALKHALGNVSNSCTMKHYEKNMKKLNKMSQGAHEYVLQKGPKHFVKAFFSWAVKCDKTNNNNSESFNSMILAARDKPIVSLHENIRNICMERIAKKSVEAAGWSGPICPEIQKVFDKIKKAAHFDCSWNGERKYELRGSFGEQYVVDVNVKECTCGAWQLSGIPCKHAVVAIRSHARFGGNPVVEEWIDPVYRVQTQSRIYSHSINPINGGDLWEHLGGLNTIVPPPYHVPAGRPHVVRRRDPDNGPKRLVRCRTCGNLGHNTKTCKGQGAPPNASTINTGTSRGRGRGRGGQGRSSRGGRGRGGRGRSAASDGRASNAGAEGGGRGRGRGRGKVSSNERVGAVGRGGNESAGASSQPILSITSNLQPNFQHESQRQSQASQSQTQPGQRQPRTWTKGGKTVTSTSALEDFRDAKRRAFEKSRE